MDIFHILSFIGGLSLFLFGMSFMGRSLERRAGNKLKNIINKLTKNRFLGLLIGTVVTAIIQSSSATTVLVVGLVNSGIMTLGQSIYVIMGANIGTTITSWILSLSGISSSNIFIKLLKPSSFTPILALIGIVLLMFFKSEKKKDTGSILLGFSVLMFGMEAMSSAVSVLKDVDWFKNLFLMFDSNPLLGVLAGLFVTAIIQSSSASVGILQAFASTGQISFGAAIPIILGQNIGTCVTSIISSVGANKNAKRASMVHLLFNVIGTLIFFIAYLLLKYIISPQILSEPASLLGIAMFHTIFNVVSVLIMIPFGKLLEKLVVAMIKDKKNSIIPLLDERLLETPSIALAQTSNVLKQMKDDVETSLTLSLEKTNNLTEVQKYEDQTDVLEDTISTYLLKLSSKKIEQETSIKVAFYLKMLNDYERIADYAVIISRLKENMETDGLKLSDTAKEELAKMSKLVLNMWKMTNNVVETNDIDSAYRSLAFDKVIMEISEDIKVKHIKRLQEGKCLYKSGINMLEIINAFERVSNHSANISGYVIDMFNKNMNSHENAEEICSNNEIFKQSLIQFEKEYLV